jgi:arsenite methyltransferase
MTAADLGASGESRQDDIGRDLAGRACPSCRPGALDGAGKGVLRPGGLALTARAMSRCALGAGARVLDLGCGTGVTVDHLRRALGLFAIGVDSSRNALAQGSRRCGAVQLVQGAGGDLPIASGSVAAVLAECSLSAMPERERVLAECWRVLASGGRLVITDLYARAPDVAAPLRALPVACAAGMTTRVELARQLEDQGFRLEVWEDHSLALAEFAARLVMAGGSPRDAWVPPGASAEEEGRITDAVRRARPGYFLLVASKMERCRGFTALDARGDRRRGSCLAPCAQGGPASDGSAAAKEGRL